MLGITDLYIILNNLDYDFDTSKVVNEDGYIIIEVRGLFNKWRKLTLAQLNLIQSILSPNYRVKLVRRLYKWVIWEQILIGGKFPC